VRWSSSSSSTFVMEALLGASSNKGFIEIYTVPTCPYCSQAKHLLRNEGLAFREIDLSTGYVTEHDYRRYERSSRIFGTRVPLVFVNNKLLGGLPALAMYVRSLQRGPVFSLGGYTPRSHSDMVVRRYCGARSLAEMPMWRWP